MAVGDMSKGILNFAGDVIQGMMKNDQAIKDSIKSANKKAVKAGKEAMNSAKIKNPDLSASSLRRIQRNAMKEAGFRSSKTTTGHKVGNFLGGGTRDTIKNMKNGDTFGKALANAHKTNGKMDAKKMAGTYMAASAAGRVATGGGLTKDKNGNTNIIGIPFI